MNGVARHNPLTQSSSNQSPSQDPTNYDKLPRSIHFKTCCSILRMWNGRHNPWTQISNPKPSPRTLFPIRIMAKSLLSFQIIIMYAIFCLRYSEFGLADKIPN